MGIFDIFKKKKTTHAMNLNPAPFEMIKRGAKTIELRLFDEKRQKINPRFFLKRGYLSLFLILESKNQAVCGHLFRKAIGALGQHLGISARQM